MGKIELAVGFKEDGSLQNIIDSIQTAKDALTDSAMASNFDQAGLGTDQITAIDEMLSSSISTLQTLTSEMSKVPSYMQMASFGLKSELEGMYDLVNRINDSYKSIGNSELSRMDTARKMLSLSASLQANTTFMGAIQKERNFGIKEQDYSKQTYGFQDYNTFLKYASEIATQRLIPLANTILNQNKHGFMNHNSLVNQIMGNDSFYHFYQDVAKKTGAGYLTPTQVEYGIEAMIAQYSLLGQQLKTGEKLKVLESKGILKTPDKRDQFVQERLANDYQVRMFNSYARDTDTENVAKRYLSSHAINGDPIRRYEKRFRKSNGLQGLQEYLRQGENMAQLFPLLKEAGIATAPTDSGYYHINSKIHESQLQFLAAKAIQRYRDALGSEAPYEIDPTNYFNTAKTLNRQGKKPQLYSGLLRALPSDVIPSLTTYDPNKPYSDVGFAYNTGIEFGKTPSLNRYYIPNTKFDISTGKLIERNPDWRKDLSKGIEKRDSDEYVAVTDSLVARMFGMKGNGTLGYGRDENTGAIIRYIQDPNNPGKKIAAPSPLISVDFTQFLKEDKETGKTVVDKNNPRIKEAMDYLAGRKLLSYGDQQYHYLYQDENGSAVFGLNDIYEQHVKRYESQGLRHPFHAGNEGDMLFGGSRKKFSKQTETIKKMASSGVPVEDLYDGLERLRTEAPLYVNFGMLYDLMDEINGTDLWGEDSGKRMNGQVWADPNLIKKSMQMRFGMGTDKFMMSGVDWRPMLKQGWKAGSALNSRIFGRDEKGNIAVYVPGGHMSTLEDYAAVKSFITGEKYGVENKKVVQIKDDKGNAVPLTSGELLKIQNERMVNLLDKNAPVLIDREAMKSEEGFRTLPIEKYRNPKRFGEAGLKRAIAEGRVEGNVVRLTSKEAARDMLEYSRSFDPSGKYSGYIAMKNDEDMASNKEYLPESLLRAINAPVDIFERSERLYRERLAELNTMSGRIKQFQNDENAMAEIRRNPNWVFENQDAIRHIANTRNALLKNRAMHKVLMPFDREGTVGQNTVGEIPEMLMGLVPGLKPSDFGKFQALLPSVMDKANAVYAPGLSQEDVSMMMRFPIATRQMALNVVNYAQSKEGKDYLKNIKTVQNLERDINDEQGYIKTQDRLIAGFNKQLSLPGISATSAKKISAQIAKAQSIKDKYVESVGKKETLRDTIQEQINLQEEEADKKPDSPVAFIRARRLTGQDPLDVATTMSASMMYQFNTGDFDGDTIYAFYNMSKEAMENARKENEAFDKYKQAQKNAQKAIDTENKIAEESAPIVDEGLGKLEVMTQNINAKTAMATASAALRKAQTANPNDPHRVAGLVESMEAYDLATSKVKKEGLEASMGEFAQMYLTSQGQHYERFTKALYENENADTPYGKNLFAVSFASKFDPEGIQAMAFRRENADGLGFIDTKSLELMEKWYGDNYGGDVSAEAEAARFMLDRLEDSQIFGKIWTNKDSQRGWRKYHDWLSEIDVKAARGLNVEEERARLNQFAKRLEEQDSDTAVNEKAIRDEIGKYSELYQKTGEDVYDKYVKQLYKMLPTEGETFAQTDPQKAILDLILKQRWKENQERASKIRGAMDAADEESSIDARIQHRRTQAVINAFDVDKMGEPGNISPYNWSSVKHYIGANDKSGAKVVMPESSALERIILRNAVGENGKIRKEAYSDKAAPLVDYNSFEGLAEAQKDMILALSGEDTKTSAYKNEYTHIGSLMHSALEAFFDPTDPLFSRTENATVRTSENRIQRARTLFRDMLLGKIDNGAQADRMALDNLGLTIEEDEKTGKLVANSSRLTITKSAQLQNRLNTMIGYTDENGDKIEGTFESFLRVMDVFAKEGERTLSIEDRLYDQAGNLTDERYGGSVWKQIVTDSDGKIIRTDYSLDKGGFKTVGENEQSHVFLTHAKPDLARINQNGEITVYDFKSSEGGSFESLLQSAFYSDMFTALGRKAYENPTDARYEVFKPWVKEVTKADGTKDYVSAVKKVVGYNPQEKGENVGIDLSSIEGKKWATDQLMRINDAFLSLEKAGTGDNPLPEGMAILVGEASKYNKIYKQREEAAKKAETFKLEENKGISDYFLSTFASQREQLTDLQKAVHQDYGRYHQNIDNTGVNKFSQREKQLQDLFNEDVKAAYIAHHGNDKAIQDELDRIAKDRIDALELNAKNAKAASIQDIQNAMTSARQAFSGVKPTTEADTVIGAFQMLARAKQTKDYLKENKEYYDATIENADGTHGKFLTEGNDARAAEAKDRERKYNEAVKLGQEADAFLLSEGQKYIDNYKTRDSKRIKDLTRMKPVDASERFNEFVESQTDSLQKEVDTYNETIMKLTEQQGQTNDPKKVMLLQDLINHAQSQKDELNEYMLSGGILDKTLRHERDRLGITTKTPEQKAEEWYNERKNLVDGTVERDALHKARTNLTNAVNTGDAEKIAEASRAYAAAQSRYDEWVNNYGGDSNARLAELKTQSENLRQMWTEQEQRPISDFERSLNRTALTRSDYVSNTVSDLQARAIQMATNSNLSENVRNQWMAIVNDQDLWKKQKQLAGEDFDRRENMAQFQHDQRMSDLQFQQEQNARAREQSYLQHNRGRFGQSTSRFVNAYRSSRDYWFSLNQSYEQSNHAAVKEQANISRLEKEIAGMGRTQQEREKHQDYKARNRELEEARERLTDYQNAAADAQEQMGKFSRPAAIMNSAFQSINGTINTLIMRFGRQLFSSVLRETTNFVKQFDASMNQIQMITLKSNEDIAQLGDSLISKAKDLKISVSEIAQSATTLYRQGLSDAEVDERLEVVSKFSKVSGTKVDAATKLITVAMNTGLVQQAQEASDIVTALGDNAATNAAEIEKGIEKAGAAAAADGTTFAQLASMLTAITSTTQIGGNVAGRTLNTIFGRMNKIGTNELIYDENGNAISGSAVAKLLEAEGIRMYDEQGNKRSTYETLYALSQKWDSLSDAKQQQFANAIAGTRQYSNFAAIMTGMSEGKVDEYMQLAGESSGITDKKYEIYTKSLNASLTDLRNTWDGLINDMTGSGAVGGFLGTITSMIQGVDNLTGSIGGLGAALAGAIPMMMIMGGLKAGPGVGWGVAAIGGIAALGLSALGNNKSAQDAYEDAIKAANERYSNRNDEILRAKELQTKGSSRTEDETAEYEKLLDKFNLTIQYSDIEQGVEEDKERRKTLVQNADEIIEQTDKRNKANRIKAFIGQKRNIVKATSDEINQLMDRYNSNVENLDNEQTQKLFANGVPTIEDLYGMGETGQAFANRTVQGTLQQTLENAVAAQYTDVLYGGENAVFQLKEGQTKEEYLDEKGYAGREADYLRKWFADNIITDGRMGDVKQKNKLLEYLTTWYKDLSPEAVRHQVESDKVNELFTKYLSENTNLEDEDQIATLAQFATSEYFSELDKNGGDVGNTFWAQIAKLFGINGQEITEQSVEEALSLNLKKARGFDKRAEKLKELNLEDVGPGGYYIDLKKKRAGEEDYYVSEQEAIKNVEAYNKQDTINKTVYKVWDKDTGEEIASFNAKDYNTPEEARLAADELAATRWYIQHPSGEGNPLDYRQYTDSNGNPLITRRQARREASLWDEKNGTWSVNITSKNPNRADHFGTGANLVQTITGNTLEEVEIESAKVLNRLKSKQYGLRVEGTATPFDVIYGTVEEQQKALDEYNAKEKERVDKINKERRAAYQAAKTASFTDYTSGEPVVYNAKGVGESAALSTKQKNAVNAFKRKYNWDGESELYRYVDLLGEEHIGTLEQLNDTVANIPYLQSRVDELRNTITTLDGEINTQQEAYNEIEANLEETWTLATPDGKQLSETIRFNGNDKTLGDGEKAINDAKEAFLKENEYVLQYAQDINSALIGYHAADEFYKYTNNPEDIKQMFVRTDRLGNQMPVSRSTLETIVGQMTESGLYPVFDEHGVVQLYESESEATRSYFNKKWGRDLDEGLMAKMLEEAASKNEFGLTKSGRGAENVVSGTVLFVDNGNITQAGKDFIADNTEFLKRYGPEISWKTRSLTKEEAFSDQYLPAVMRMLGLEYMFKATKTEDLLPGAVRAGNIEKTTSQLEGLQKQIADLNTNKNIAASTLKTAEIALNAAEQMHYAYQHVQIGKDNSIVAYGPLTQELISGVTYSEVEPIVEEVARYAKPYNTNPQIGEITLRDQSKAHKQNLGVYKTTDELLGSLEKLEKPEYLAIRDYFLSGATSSYTSWLTDSKNAYATNADEMLRIIMSSGTNNLQGLMKTINEYTDANGEIKGIKEWNSLYQNAEFGRIMSSIKTDEHGRILNDEETQRQVFDQIMNFLSTNGRDYGTLNVTSAEKAQKALQAYQGLRGYDINGNELAAGAWYVSEEARNNAIEKEYEKQVIDPIKEKYKPIIEDAEKAKDIELVNRAKSEMSKEILETKRERYTLNDFAKTNGIGYLDDLSAEYLTGIIGAELTQKVKLNNGKDLTDIENEYIQQRLNNAQYGISGLTRQQQLEGAKLLSESNIEERKKLIQESPQIVSQWLNGFSDAEMYLSAMQKDIADRTEDEIRAVEAYDNWYKTETEKYDFKWSNDRNASKLLQNYTTLLEGTETEKYSMFNNWYTQSQEAANAQYLISSGSNTSENRRILTSLLSMSDQQVNDLMKDDTGRKKLAERLNSKSSDILDEFMKSLNLDGIDPASLDKSKAIAVAAEQGMGDMANMILSMFGDINYDAIAKRFTGEVNAEIEKTAGQAYNEQVQELGTQTQKLIGATWLQSNMSNLLNYVGTVQYDKEKMRGYRATISDAIDYYAKATGYDPEVIKAAFSPETVGLLQAYTGKNGTLSEETLSAFLTNAATGGTKKAALAEGLKNDFFKGFIDENGNIDATKLEEIQTRIKQAIANPESGDYTVWQLLTGYYSDFIKLLTSQNTEEAINVLDRLRESMGKDAMSEAIADLDLPKDMADALQQIAQGGSDAAIGFSNLSDAITDAANELVALRRIEGKSGKQLNRNELSYLSSVTGIKTSDLKLKTKEDLEAIRASGKDKEILQDVVKSVVQSGSSLSKNGFKADLVRYDKNGYIDFSAATESMNDEEKNNWMAFQNMLTALQDAGFGVNDTGAMLKAIGVDVSTFKPTQMNLDDSSKLKSKVEKVYTDVGTEVNKIISNNQELQDKFTFDINGHVVFDGEDKNIEKQVKTLNEKIDKEGVGIYLQTFIDGLGTGGSGGGAGGNLLGAIGALLVNMFTGGGLSGLLSGTEGGSGGGGTQEGNSFLTFFSNLFGGKRKTGGGGGAPAWQKKLQEIEHEVKVSEHNIKMAQLKQDYYGNINNYEKQLKWINKEDKAYKALEKSLKKNIEDLEKEREKASKTSQEYKKLTEAINQYKEKLQETINTRSKLLEKKISVEEEKQEWADTKQTHQRTMIDTYLDRAKTIYERGGTVSQDQAFGDYMSQLQARKQATQDQYNLNLEQIAAWEKMLKKAKKNSDQWRTIQQKIWELQEENAQLESEMIDQQIEENEALLAKIVTKLQNMTARSEFYANMAGYDAQKFQMVKGYSQYRTQLGYQRSAYSGQLDMYRTAIAEATAYRDSQAIGSAAWYEADKEVMALTETFSKLQLTIQQTDKAIAESYLTETMDKFDFSDSYLSARGTMAQQQTQRYQMVGAYALMAESMEEEMGVTKLKYDETKAAYDQLSADLAAGKFDSEPEVRDQVMKQLETFGATLSQLSTQIMEQALKIVQTKIQGMESSYESSVGSTLHQIDLTRYQQTRFKNAGELTNYGKALEYELGLQQSVVEPEMAKTLERAKKFYEEQVETYGPSSPEAKAALEFYQKLQKQHEELIGQIEDETRALEENKEAIRKVQMEYENTLDRVIEAQKQKQKDMLAATVSLQNQMLESIKDRFKQEWELVKEDIDKKKQALQEEKNIIRERLNAKREADNAEDLESKRAELQKQLALIEGDTTQTKQAKELRERIKEINKQIADLQDERQVKAEEDRIDKQIKAYEDYVEDEDKRIDRLLEDNNNFAEELDRLLNGSFEDYWTEVTKDQKYQTMTKEELEQARQAASDTWDKMKDIIRTNWDDIKQMIGSMDRDSFISYMMENDEEYRKASDTGKESLKYQYGELYDKYVSSTLDTYTPEYYDKTDYGLEEASIETLQDQMRGFYDKFDQYKIFEVPKTLETIQATLASEKQTREDLIKQAQDAVVAAIKGIPGYNPETPEESPQPQAEEPAAQPEPEVQYTQEHDGGDKGKDEEGTNPDLSAARNALYELAANYNKESADAHLTDGFREGIKWWFKIYAEGWKAAKEGRQYKDLPTRKFSALGDIIRTESKFFKENFPDDFAFKEGGYVNYTGPAWVDGTPKKPEAFLDYIDTKNIRDLADSLRYVSPFIGAMPALDMIGYGNTSTIGDINITINQAELKQDADYDEVARKIGKAFTRQLQKDGFNLANYAF